MLQSIRAKRNLALSFKNNIALMQSLELLGQIPKEELEGASLRIGDFIEVSLPALSKDTQTLIYNVAASLIPWRKGPFKIHHLTISPHIQDLYPPIKASLSLTLKRHCAIDNS